jgi:hypothetical protein
MCDAACCCSLQQLLLLLLLHLLFQPALARGYIK